jgi:RNA polymerase sigma-70 factor (ECF subfamily)
MLKPMLKSARGEKERELIRATAAGDRSAYRQLFERHAARVFSVAWRILGNRQDSEDVAQEVFLTLWRKAGTIRGEARLSTWLHRVAVNKALNARKRGGILDGLRVIFSLEDAPEAELSAPADSQPDRQQEMSSARVELTELLAQLPARQREVYLLHKLEGLAYREIAAELNVTLPAVESLMHRAKVKLQKEMLKKHRKRRK